MMPPPLPPAGGIVATGGTPQMVSTDELRRQMRQQFKMRRWPYGIAFLAAAAVGGAFIVVRVLELPQWWVYNTACGLVMIAGAGVLILVAYFERRGALLRKQDFRLFERK